MIASEFSRMPLASAASADVERLHSKYRHILGERRERLSCANLRMLVMLYANGKELNLRDKFESTYFKPK